MGSLSSDDETPGTQYRGRHQNVLERPPCRVPRRACEAWGAGWSFDSVLAGGVGQQTLVDLAERDGEGLLLRGGVDQGADVLEQALGELAVVGVDLTRALGGEDDQAVLAAGALEQLVDRRVGDAL